MIDIKANAIRFKELVKTNIHRDGIDQLMNWLDTTDFYTAPASARKHGAEPGGLCAHSLMVYNCLKKMQDNESDESIAITALFHDLCKVNFYKTSMRNTKDDSGRWIQVPYYETNTDDDFPLGHGEKSMYIINQYMKMSIDEACAIRWHMGGYTLEQIYEKPQEMLALAKYKIVLKLQTADAQADFWYNI